MNKPKRKTKQSSKAGTAKKLPGLPEGTRIIECTNIELTGKDQITINNWSDFLYLAGTGPIYRLKNALYLLTDEVIYIYIHDKSST